MRQHDDIDERKQCCLMFNQSEVSNLWWPVKTTDYWSKPSVEIQTWKQQQEKTRNEELQLAEKWQNSSYITFFSQISSSMIRTWRIYRENLVRNVKTVEFSKKKHSSCFISSYGVQSGVCLDPDGVEACQSKACSIFKRDICWNTDANIKSYFYQKSHEIVSFDDF